MTALSFSQKGDVGKYFNDENRYHKLIESQQKSWQRYVDEATSFIVKDVKDGRMVGVCINQKFHFNPSEECTNPLPQDFTANINALINFLNSLFVYVFVFFSVVYRLSFNLFPLNYCILSSFTVINCQPKNPFWKVLLLQHMKV